MCISEEVFVANAKIISLLYYIYNNSVLVLVLGFLTDISFLSEVPLIIVVHFCINLGLHWCLRRVQAPRPGCKQLGAKQREPDPHQRKRGIPDSGEGPGGGYLGE